MHKMQLSLQKKKDGINNFSRVVKFKIHIYKVSKANNEQSNNETDKIKSLILAPKIVGGNSGKRGVKTKH